MKKTVFTTLFLILALVLWTNVFAAGSSTLTGPVTSFSEGQTRAVYTITFVGDASTGAIPSVVIPSATYPGGMYLIAVESLAGSPAPTTGWGITVVDAMSVDLLTGNGAGQSVSPSAGVATMPLKWVPVMDNLTVGFTGNSAGSAAGTVRLIFTSN